ncbi:MAG TPA: prolyl oligopeptidase family serine peptidase, partial [Polyangiaceae bacterium]|nr:prolyl oligopeptidase family serine peptidase [Polyangiaceae bacterium]
PTAPSPPPTRRDELSETLHGIQVDDPYRWLEDASKPEVQSWVTAQNAHARLLLDALPSQAKLRQRFAELLYLDAVSPPEERGGQLFYTRRYKTREKPVLMVRPQRASNAPGQEHGQEQGQEHSEERTLIDPNELRADGSISLGNWFVSWDGKYVAYTLHENNADEATLFVRDVATGTDSAIDRITGAKYAGPTWTPDNRGFYYEWLPTDPSIPVAERPGRTELRYHRLGTDPAQDPLVFPATRDPKTFLGGGVTRDGRWLIVSVQQGWQQNDVYVRDARLPLTGLKDDAADVAAAGTSPSGAGAARAKASAARFGFVPFVTGLDGMFRVSWWNGAFYVHTNYEAPNYRVLRLESKKWSSKPAAASKPSTANKGGATQSIAPNEFALDQWREIVPESPAKLDDASVIGGALVLSYLENAASRLAIHDLSGKRLRSVSLPGLGSASGLVGDPDRDEAYFAFTSFTVPTQVYQAYIEHGSTSLWSQIELPLDTSQMQVEQTWYHSKDGTKVSMFVVHRAGIQLDGSHPTLLYGYGGFNIDMTPAFSALAAVWLEQGGVYAVPNLRGGGEYGEAWHRAGMGPNKQNVFDDFAAAAEHLIERGYTTSERLGIYGGSNGGLLVGASMVQHPELFAAVACAVPLLDMVRYHRFGSGQTWIAEYGSPEDPVEFATLFDYSPYHHVLPGVKYPALLMLAADSDDRVDPMHARKFAAAVQWAGSGRPALFRVEENAGHGGADLVKKRVAYNSDLTAFLLDQLAPRS